MKSKPITFMVVDDSTVIREQIEHILGRAGYQFVGGSPDGLQAIHDFKARRPQLVMMDLTMPKVDGAETIRRIMAIDSTVALRLGAYGFLAKPFTSQQLTDAISKLLNNNHNK